MSHDDINTVRSHKDRDNINFPHESLKSGVQDSVSKTEHQGDETGTIDHEEEIVSNQNGIVEDEEPEFFEPADFISKPEITKGFAKKDDITLHHSFGYDCQQYFNLCVADEETLIFLSGNLINIFNIHTQTIEFRRSCGGGGLGHITKNPKHSHLAVGEKGENPHIIVYEWPSFEIVSILREGTTHAFTHLNYSPDGEMLCSQGGEPDFLITIWNWNLSHIILRTKCHGQDVYNAEFSLYVPGQLVSSGLGHIKFWKMAQTFTGLKLQGELGRFGKTEICDIIGIFAMPDEIVLSGSEWGNILVWEGGLIKLEVRQRSQRTCHIGPISQIHYCNNTNQVTTIGMDGWIKIWTYNTIEMADPPEDDRFIDMHPLYEIQLKDDIGVAKLRSIIKKNDSIDDFDWFAQDANGGIFHVSLNPSDPREYKNRLFTCHPAKVVAVVASPVSHFIATLGEEGYLNIYNVLLKNLVLQRKFCAGGKCLVWLPLHVESTGTVLVGGFTDGQVRVIVLTIKQRRSGVDKSQSYISIIQISKPHISAVNRISLNSRGSILVTGGEDATVFIYTIQSKHPYIVLFPSGYIDVPGPVSYIEWKPNSISTALISCWNSYFVEISLPEYTNKSSDASYKLDICTRVSQFVSVKSEILQSILIEEIESRKQLHMEKRKQELEKIKAENPGLDIDEQLFIEEMQEEEEPLPPLYYPENPAPILFAKYTSDDTVWVSPAGYDAGFIYEYDFSNPRPLRCTRVPGAEDDEICAFQIISANDYFVLGFGNGKVRMVQVNKNCHYDLSEYWQLSMHDNDNGKINSFALNHDKSLLFCCGDDGNVFSFTLNNFSDDTRAQRKSAVLRFGVPVDVLEDIDGNTELSLEETKQEAEHMKHLEQVNRKKENVLHLIQNLKQTFKNILSWNDLLPQSQKLPVSAFELDPRITQCIQDITDKENNLLQRQTAFIMMKSHLRLNKMKKYFLDPINTMTVIVHGISKDFEVKTFMHRKLSDDFIQTEIDVKQIAINTAVDQDLLDIRLEGRRASFMTSMAASRVGSLDIFLSRQTPMYSKLSIKILRLIQRLKLLKLAKEHRAREWHIFYDQQPDINVDDPEDVKAFKLAEKTIGDFKLKTDPSYIDLESKRVTTLQKFMELLQIHREIFHKKNNFNKKVLELRDKKISLVRKIKQMLHDLIILQSELAPEKRKELPTLAEMNIYHHFPENEFKISAHDDPGIYVPVPNPYDEEFLVLKVDKQNPANTDSYQSNVYYYFYSGNSRHSEELMTDDNEDTPWEKEMKTLRMIRLLYEQDNIIRELRSDIELFDKSIEELCIERFQVAIDVKYLEHHYFCCYQEFIIIESYSALEDEIFSKISESSAIKEDKVNQIHSTEIQIDLKFAEVHMLEEKIAAVQKGFIDMVSGNKFAVFLTRIFKKKKKIQRASTLSDSDTESSTTDDDEVEMEEDDDESPDYIPLRLDENTCPTGCDQSLFETTISMRGEKYSFEESLVELKKVIESLQKESDGNQKLLTILDAVLQKNILELKLLQREKQKKLNDVEGLVVLHLSQLQHFSNSQAVLQQSVLFSNENLTILQCRVGELESEMKHEKLKSKMHKRYRGKLEKEQKILEGKIENMKKLITETKVRKFGKVIDEEALEETVLRKMIYEARTNYYVTLLRKEMDKRVNEAKEMVMVKSEELAGYLKKNTKKLKLLTMLMEENTNLVELLHNQTQEKDKHISEKDKIEEYFGNVKMLTRVLQEQNEEKEQCLREMQELKLKKGACHVCSAGDAPLELHEKKQVREKGELLADDFFDRVKNVANRLIDEVLIHVTNEVENLIETAGTRSAAKVHRFVTKLVEEVVNKVVEKLEVLEKMEAQTSEASVEVLPLQSKSGEEIGVVVLEEVLLQVFESVHGKVAKQYDVTDKRESTGTERVKEESQVEEKTEVVSKVIEDLFSFIPSASFTKVNVEDVKERTETNSETLRKLSIEKFASQIAEEIASKASFIVKQNMLKSKRDIGIPTVQFPEEIEFTSSGEKITHELLDAILTDVTDMFEILVSGNSFEAEGFGNMASSKSDN